MPEASDQAILLLVVAARLLVPLAIPFYPIPAGIASLVIDGVDKSILQTATHLDLAAYQSYDKALDIYYLAIAYLSTMRNWANLPAFRLSRLLFYYRLVGSLLFELTHIRAVLLFFPNTFEYFFLFYEGVRLRWNPKRLTPASVIGAAFVIWVFIKIPQEYWIHIAQLDATDTIKLRLFGVPVDTSWSSIVAQNLPIVIALVVATIVLAAAARWLIVTWLPPADWPLSFAADSHGRDVAPEEARAAQEASASKLLDAELFEKIVLVSLVTVIFSQILPSLQATVLQTASGVAIVIVANTIVSEWLVRRSVVWHSALAEFAAMAVTNILAAALFLLLLPIGGGRLDGPATLFVLLLLTLLVTLYDRFRPFYQVRAGRARAPQPIPG